MSHDVQPGWYQNPDGSNSKRYWDGGQWTNAVADFDIKKSLEDSDDTPRVDSIFETTNNKPAKKIIFPSNIVLEKTKPSYVDIDLADQSENLVKLFKERVQYETVKHYWYLDYPFPLHCLPEYKFPKGFKAPDITVTVYRELDRKGLIRFVISGMNSLSVDIKEAVLKQFINDIFEDIHNKSLNKNLGNQEIKSRDLSVANEINTFIYDIKYIPDSALIHVKIDRLTPNVKKYLLKKVDSFGGLDISGVTGTYKDKDLDSYTKYKIKYRDVTLKEFEITLNNERKLDQDQMKLMTANLINHWENESQPIAKINGNIDGNKKGLIGTTVEHIIENYLNLKGRTPRRYYWTYQFLSIGLIFGNFAIWTLFSSFLSSDSAQIMLLLTTGAILVALIPIELGIRVRRLHDIDLSAWTLLILLIPLVNLFFLIYFSIAPSHKGPNKYGAEI